MRSTIRWVATFSLLAVVLVTAGCGRGELPDLGEVTGTVTMDGNPLSGVIVVFKPEVGRAGSATTDANGKYELIYRYGVNGTKIGMNTISLEWPTGYTGGGPAIPAKYGGRTELKEEVNPGKNVIDIELESEADAPTQPPVE